MLDIQTTGKILQPISRVTALCAIFVAVQDMVGPLPPLEESPQGPNRGFIKSYSQKKRERFAASMLRGATSAVTASQGAQEQAVTTQAAGGAPANPGSAVAQQATRVIEAIIVLQLAAFFQTASMQNSQQQMLPLDTVRAQPQQFFSPPGTPA